jgi:hypothetical protein
MKRPANVSGPMCAKSGSLLALTVFSLFDNLLLTAAYYGDYR